MHRNVVREMRVLSSDFIQGARPVSDAQGTLTNTRWEQSSITPLGKTWGGGRAGNVPATFSWLVMFRLGLLLKEVRYSSNVMGVGGGKKKSIIMPLGKLYPISPKCELRSCNSAVPAYLNASFQQKHVLESWLGKYGCCGNRTGRRRNKCFLKSSPS